MEPENESNINGRTTVRELQANLFPVPAKATVNGFFANFYLKSSEMQEDDRQDDQNDVDIIRYGMREAQITRDFFTINRTYYTIAQPARWPAECQVIADRIKHIHFVPSIPEPYYVPTGREPQPKSAGADFGMIVYQYSPLSAVNYFSRSSVGGSKYLLETNICPELDSLRFESRFESGNLERAIRITDTYYELYIRSDLYTNRHMQWFYFRVTNMKKNHLYRFCIVNFTKDGSLYSEGMKPLMYSIKESQLRSIGWMRCGDDISYYCNDLESSDDESSQPTTYTLTFTLQFPYENDEVYLANSYPYTYSELQDYLMKLINNPIIATHTTLGLLCKTLAGNNVYCLSITTPVGGAGESKKKRAIILTARVHPGEAPSSWMMKGVIDFLTSNLPQAKELRDKFIFKIVPMLNPDGVIVGNNRCSLAAKDLNRQYRSVMKETYPSIWYTKFMIRRLVEECGVCMYCDFHAHSRRHNIFTYGCEPRKTPDKKLQEQVFPLMLHKNAADKFSFESCTFRVQKIKEGTGRVVMWMMGIANSYTIEASFAGSTLATRVDTHFNVQDYEQMGKAFCLTLLDYFDEEPRKEKLKNKMLSRLIQEGSTSEEPTNIRMSDYTSDGDTSSSSSNEGGRFESYMSLRVPPPSPIGFKKPNSKRKFTRRRNKSIKKPKAVTSRRLLPICKTDLGVPISSKINTYLSETSSESESEYEKSKAEKVKFRKRSKKKKTPKKAVDYSYSEMEISKKTVTRTRSANEILPKSVEIALKELKKPTAKYKRKSQNTRTNDETLNQLMEVQNRLCSIKTRLWLGLENGDDQHEWAKTTSDLNPPQPPPPPPVRPKEADIKRNKKSQKKLAKSASKEKSKMKNIDNCSTKPYGTRKHGLTSDLDYIPCDFLSKTHLHYFQLVSQTHIGEKEAKKQSKPKTKKKNAKKLKAVSKVKVITTKSEPKRAGHLST